MNSRRRILAVSLAAFVALGFGMLLMLLRYGRPLYYSDGLTGQAGASLSQASMLEFGEARVLAELPGEIVGRVAYLPDGRWIYGLRNAEGQVDLVVQDPKRPGLPPVPLEELNSEGLDFAPAMGPGPALYFTSDRAGGFGGLDLYRSEWREGSFGPVLALRDGINSEADESDPAPAIAGPLAESLVFIRQEQKAEYSQLCVASIAGEDEASLVFPEWEAPAYRAMLRDPIFDPSGQSLYFVRRSRKSVSLLRTALHQGDFLEAWPLAGLDRNAGWRSPLPGSRGLSIDLLRPGKPALLYRSEAQERLVFWEGQRDLERLLFAGLLFSVLLVILITLGGRWSQLDLLTKLLLLSLFIHGLVLLWMSRVDILTRSQEGTSEQGTIEVEILSQEISASQGEGRMEVEPVKELAFEPTKAKLRVEGPQSLVAEASPASPLDRPVEMPVVQPELPSPDEGTTSLSDAVEAPKPEIVEESLAGMEVQEQRRPQQVQVDSRAAEVRADRHEARTLSVRVPNTASLPSRNEGIRVSRTAESPLVDLSNPVPDAELASLSDSVEVANPKRVQESLVGLEATRKSAAKPMAVQDPAGEIRVDERAAGAFSVQIPRTNTVLKSGRGARGARASERSEISSFVPTGTAIASATIQDERSRQERAVGALMKTGISENATQLSGGILPDASPGAQTAASAVPGFARKRGLEVVRPTSSLTAAPAPGSALTRSRTRQGRRPGRIDDGEIASAAGGPVASEADMADEVPAGVAKSGKTTGSGPGRKGRLVPVSESTSALEHGTVAPLEPMKTRERNVRGQPRSQTSLASKLGDLPLPETLLSPARRARHESKVPRENPRPEIFRNRFGSARIAALRRFGGTKKTEAAVRSGLAYLARVQREDGSWGNKAKIDRKYGETFVGKTGLCLLAFLGAGHVPGKGHAYSKVARRATEFLLYVQDEETGHFGLSSSYSHGISTYALAECYALSRDEKLEAPLEAAVTWILENQNRSRDRRHDGGWGYYSPTLRREDDYARTSVSSWQVMALLSAEKAGMVVPKRALERARSFFGNNYDRRRGYFLYSREPSRLRSRWRTLPASSPASVFSLLLLGEKKDSASVVGGLGFTLARRPRSYRWRGDDAFVRNAEGNTYFWYYGSLACFMAGGETWKQWNQSLAAVLPQAQLGDGSFRPLGPYAAYAGDDARDRSYTTAMCVLSLEVYYRYFTPLLQGRR